MRSQLRAAKAKVLATLGPASEERDVVRTLAERGADAFRLNLSHGDPEWHRRMAGIVREETEDAPVALLADLQGPRIRIGDLDEPVQLADGDEVLIAGGEDDSSALPTTYPGLVQDVKPGDRLLIDGGMVELRVIATEEGRVRCRVVAGGTVKTRKGINLPGVDLSTPTLTEKDRDDARLAVEFGADYLALSFVRSPQDIEELRSLLADLGADLPIIAKIERGEAVDRIEDIVAAADGVMVARGDLAVEISHEAVPGVQKRIIAQANAAGKLVITATEMLQSMVNNPSPTRAEAADVANAILDGTDVVMLSDETSVGTSPARAVETMGRIAREAETIRREFHFRPPLEPDGSFAGAVADAACTAADKLNATAVVVFTMTGQTARLVAQHRPATRIIAFTTTEEVRRRLRLRWGIIPLMLEEVHDADELVERADERLKESGLAEKDDVVVIVGGAGPLTGATNFTKMHRVR